MCLFKDVSVRVFHGENERENNRLKQKAGDKMGNCALPYPHVCVYMCMTVYLFIEAPWEQSAITMLRLKIWWGFAGCHSEVVSQLLASDASSGPSNAPSDIKDCVSPAVSF